MTIIDIILEAEDGQKARVKTRKSRVRIFPTIKKALTAGIGYGAKFSTKNAKRLYVTTKPTWGKKRRAGGNSIVAKGFTPGSATPSAAWPSIVGHAARTKAKHGAVRSEKSEKLYGAGRKVTSTEKSRRTMGKSKAY